MSKYRYLDDAVLLALLSREEDETWQTAYEVFRKPFVKFFQHFNPNELPDEVCLEVYESVFTIMIIEINNQAIRPPINNYLFYHLLIIGKKMIDKRQGKESAALFFKESLANAERHLAVDVLLTLALRMHAKEKVLSELDKKYKKPAHDIINHKGNFKNQEAADSYSFSLFTLWNNMITAVIKPPFRGLLFNYFLVIFWRKTRDDTGSRKQKKKAERDIEGEDLAVKSKEQLVDMREWSDYFTEMTEEDTYTDYLLTAYPVLQRFDFEADEGLAMQIIQQMEGRLRKIFELRYLEGLTYPKIALRLKELEEIADETDGESEDNETPEDMKAANKIKKAHFDGIRKLRKLLNVTIAKS